MSWNNKAILTLKTQAFGDEKVKLRIIELGQVNSLKNIQKIKKNALFNNLNLVRNKKKKKDPEGKEHKQDSLRNRMFTFANNTEPVTNFENILDEQKTTTTNYHLKKVYYF